MPTAIVKVYTKDGFVIGADGRCRQAETGVVVSDTAQKIFLIINPDRTLAYAVYGTLGITDASNQSVVVDLASAIHKSVSAMAQSPARHDLTWYVSKLWPPAYEALLRVSKNREIGPFPDAPGDPGLIAHVFFWGYYRGTAAEMDLQFRHENQKIIRPRLRPSQRIKALDICGSLKVANSVISSDDPRFAKYRTPATDLRNKKSLSLTDGIDIVQSYIRACDSDEGREIDSLCAGIGGHIHIALVTPSGFRWHIPPHELTSAGFETKPMSQEKTLPKSECRPRK